ncbi:MAG: DNA cytosine methyltransferase [Arcobacteraceae bacterium]|jgi:DNA (cytosine-5)-methyltransferase 1|nr:DNA cytosine methyltransferase [Arcobacteraceae bacterium]
MKILNLYAGVGGNRKLWGDEHQITSIEYDEAIANAYKDMYPGDTVIVCDAHEYLLKHYKEYDFIWSSPPCPTHSDIRRCGVHSGQYMALYPDMKLYEEIILLKHFAPFRTKWVIENVKPYYNYLIKPDIVLHRHPFWCNFKIRFTKIHDTRKHLDIVGSKTVYGVSLQKYDIFDKRKVLRNMVNPKLGKYILDQAMEKKIVVQNGLFEDYEV